MLYKVVASRGIWSGVKNANGKSLLAKSRVEFHEESELQYNDYYRLIMSQFKGWIYTIKRENNVKN